MNTMLERFLKNAGFIDDPEREIILSSYEIDLKELLRKIRRIEILTRKLVNEQIAGQYHSVFKGRGMNFDEVRPYHRGDEIRFIDWNVTARTGEVYVKQFIEERELTINLLVDLSQTMNFGSTSQTKREMAAEVASVLSFSAVENNDRVGLITFTDRVEKYIPPKKGRKNVLRVIREILSPQIKGKGTKIDVAIDYLNKVSKRRSVAFLISDFKGDGYYRSIQVASKRHDFIPIIISDPMEENLQSMGNIPFFDPESNDVKWFYLSDRFTKKFNLEAKIERAKLETFFKKHRIDFIALRTGSAYTKPLLNYFRLRGKKY